MRRDAMEKFHDLFSSYEASPDICEDHRNLNTETWDRL